MPRVLGIDYGTRRVGLAISDPSGMIAQPLPALVRRAGKRPPVQRIAELALANDASAIVVGLPLAASGEEDDWTREVREFGEKLGERTGLPVHFVDERMTSARAERVVRSLGLKRSEREQKTRVDTTAAMLILQAFLDQAGRE
ncbi:MAG TPA: Holliday junction resolvase RuvX [Longimicrobiales bacterium]|nr:Holliday junction resolvase RuvX [Longimicrobiales bacterium]